MDTAKQWRPRVSLVLIVPVVLLGLAACQKAPDKTPAPSAAPDTATVPADEARAIAKEAYIYGFPLVDSYRIQYSYFVDQNNPEYKGGWNEIHNTARVYTPDDKAVQTPNSDTPYSFLGADLRTEPLVLTMPAVDEGRYYSAQFVDMYTHNFGYVGSRATGNDAGSFLLAGPAWKGETPPGIKSVLRSETELAFVVYRTQLFDASDIENVKKNQAGYQLAPFVGVSRYSATNGAAENRLHRAVDARTAEDIAGVLPHPELRAAVLPDPSE